MPGATSVDASLHEAVHQKIPDKRTVIRPKSVILSLTRTLRRGHNSSVSIALSNKKSKHWQIDYLLQLLQREADQSTMNSHACSEMYIMRFRKLLIAVTIGALVLAAASLTIPPLCWTGGAAVHLSITAVDALAGTGVPGAQITCRQQVDLSTSRPAQWPVWITDEKGSATVTWLFGAGGKSYVFFRTGTVSFEGQMFVVEAPGYQTLTCPVSDYTGYSRSLWAARRIPPITLKLVASKITGHNERVGNPDSSPCRAPDRESVHSFAVGARP